MTDQSYKDIAPGMRQHRGTKATTVAALALAGTFVLACLFQLFFRYAYVKSGATILRIDRLTTRACVMYPRGGDALDALMYPAGSAC